MSPLPAAISFGQALLTVLEVFLLVIWVWLFVTVILDLFRDDGISGWAKAGWVILLIVLPILGVLIYLIARGDKMRERYIVQQRELRQATDEYVRSVAASLADELAKLNELREKGALSAEEFAQAKASLLSRQPAVSG